VATHRNWCRTVVAAALLISRAYFQTQHAEQRNSVLRANLSALSIQQLVTRFLNCQPQSKRLLHPQRRQSRVRDRGDIEEAWDREIDGELRTHRKQGTLRFTRNICLD
jgi:hypothetical protein